MIIANDQYICKVKAAKIQYFSTQNSFSTQHSNISDVNATFNITTATLPADSSMLYLTDGEYLYTLDMRHANDDIRRVTIPKTGSIRQLYSAANSICTLLVLLTETELILATDRNGVVHAIRNAIPHPSLFYSMDLSSYAHLATSPPGMSTPTSETSPPINFFLSIALQNMQSIEYGFSISLIDNTSLSINIASTSTLIPKVPQAVLFLKYFGRQILFVTAEMLYLISQADYLAIPISQSLSKSIRNTKIYSLISSPSANSNASAPNDKNLSCIVILFCKRANCHVVNLATQVVKEIPDTNNMEHAYESNMNFCFISEVSQKDIPLAELSKYF